MPTLPLQYLFSASVVQRLYIKEACCFVSFSISVSDDLDVVFLGSQSATRQSEEQHRHPELDYDHCHSNQGCEGGFLVLINVQLSVYTAVYRHFVYSCAVKSEQGTWNSVDFASCICFEEPCVINSSHTQGMTKGLASQTGDTFVNSNSARNKLKGVSNQKHG